MIAAGTVERANRESGNRVFVDLGFSSRSKSCRIGVADAKPSTLHPVDRRDRWAYPDSVDG